MGIMQALKETTKEQMISIKDISMGILHIRTMSEAILTSILSTIGGIFGYFSLVVVDNENAFKGLILVVMMDWLFGMALAYKNNTFMTRKAIKVVFYITGYSIILTVVLAIEKGFNYAEWLTEAVMLPIIVFSIVGSLKKASLLGLLPRGVLLQILENIDNYQNQLKNGGQADNGEINETPSAT